MAAPGGARGRTRDAVEPAGAVEASAVVWTATGLERQVFLDHTGRRGRRVRLAGAGMALASAGWLAALVTGSLGFSTLPSLPPAIGTLAARPVPAAVHLASSHRFRRRVVETAEVTPTAGVTGRDIALGGTRPAGTIR
jgi:hypothetical protein